MTLPHAEFMYTYSTLEIWSPLDSGYGAGGNIRELTCCGMAQRGDYPSWEREGSTPGEKFTVTEM